MISRTNSPEKYLQRSTVIHFSVTDRNTVLIVKTATVTAVDMVSNIGGTLGLFCGFSILSGLEVMYWAGRYTFKKLQKNKIINVA